MTYAEIHGALAEAAIKATAVSAGAAYLAGRAAAEAGRSRLTNPHDFINDRVGAMNWTFGWEDAKEAANHQPERTVRQGPCKVAQVELFDALAVMVTDPLIRGWLEANDKMALKQAEAALAGAYRIKES